MTARRCFLVSINAVWPAQPFIFALHICIAVFNFSRNLLSPLSDSGQESRPDLSNKKSDFI